MNVAQAAVSVPVDNWHYYLIGGILLGGSAIVAWIRFFRKEGADLQKAQATADKAQEDADEIREELNAFKEKVAGNVAELHSRIDKHGDQLNLHVAAFHLYREQVAREYIHRETMKEVEDRLTGAINRLGDRFDKLIEAALNAVKSP